MMTLHCRAASNSDEQTKEQAAESELLLRQGQGIDQRYVKIDLHKETSYLAFLRLPLRNRTLIPRYPSKPL